MIRFFPKALLIGVFCFGIWFLAFPQCEESAIQPLASSTSENTGYITQSQTITLKTFPSIKVTTTETGAISYTKKVDPLVHFFAKASTEAGTIQIEWDALEEGSNTKVKIIRDSAGYITDASLVADDDAILISTGNTYTDSGLSDGYYFYMAYAYQTNDANEKTYSEGVGSFVYLNGTTPNQIRVEADTFLMGSQSDYGVNDEHQGGVVNNGPVSISFDRSLYVDIHEVTNEEFYRAITDKDGLGSKLYDPYQEIWGDDGLAWLDVEDVQVNYNPENPFPRFWTSQSDYTLNNLYSAEPNSPVVGVSWYEASAYCQRVGKRLATEAEWEYLSKQNDSDTNRYPWGNAKPTEAEWRLNMDALEDGVFNDTTQDGFINAAMVCSFTQGKSPFGIFDMAGNAAEWVSDWYAADYFEDRDNPIGPIESMMEEWRPVTLFDVNHLKIDGIDKTYVYTTGRTLLIFTNDFTYFESSVLSSSYNAIDNYTLIKYDTQNQVLTADPDHMLIENLKNPEGLVPEWLDEKAALQFLDTNKIVIVGVDKTTFYTQGRQIRVFKSTSDSFDSYVIQSNYDQESVGNTVVEFYDNEEDISDPEPVALQYVNQSDLAMEETAEIQRTGNQDFIIVGVDRTDVYARGAKIRIYTSAYEYFDTAVTFVNYGSQNTLIEFDHGRIDANPFALLREERLRVITGKVIRGGGWGDMLYNCRTASRNHMTLHSRTSTVGFRCVADAM